MAEFLVTYRVTGRVTQIVNAPDKEAAEAAIEEKLYDGGRDEWGEFIYDLEEVDDVDYDLAEMTLVVRDGRQVKTTYVRSTDVRVQENGEIVE